MRYIQFGIQFLLTDFSRIWTHFISVLKATQLIFGLHISKMYFKGQDNLH